ncbi:hypothetical protein MTO96_031238 [Rhipicephalus appendiculatus]
MLRDFQKVLEGFLLHQRLVGGHRQRDQEHSPHHLVYRNPLSQSNLVLEQGKFLVLVVTLHDHLGLDLRLHRQEPLCFRKDHHRDPPQPPSPPLRPPGPPAPQPPPRFPGPPPPRPSPPPQRPPQPPFPPGPQGRPPVPGGPPPITETSNTLSPRHPKDHNLRFLHHQHPKGHHLV